MFLNDSKKRNNNSVKSSNYSGKWWEVGTKGGTKNVTHSSFPVASTESNIFLMLVKETEVHFILK